MMKLRLYLRNLIKCGLLFSSLVGLAYFAYGCSSSISPTYLKEDIGEAIERICRNEYKIEVKAKVVGQTLWVYMPVDSVVAKTKTPTKYTERFTIQQNKSQLTNDAVKLDYSIQLVPESEKTQEYNYDKAAMEKINNLWKTIRRVLFSAERSEKKEPKFCCIIASDIKNGFETKETFYYLDLKKVTYEFISWTEYQHRSIEETNASADIIGDSQGRHINYRNITLEEFVPLQIQHRIRLKFQRPEVARTVDIDKEIQKVAIYTIRTYDFTNFKALELNNLLTKNRVILNRPAVWARPIE